MTRRRAVRELGTVTLELVENKTDIVVSVYNFNIEAMNYLTDARNVTRQTRYWVYNHDNRTFGPNKFSGHKNMTFEKYREAVKGNFNGLNYFSGGKTRYHIENILGSYKPNHDLTIKLVNWAQTILGNSVFNDVDVQKWEFIIINW
jgi:hypothetical protein